jgi:hypothetical protein
MAVTTHAPNTSLIGEINSLICPVNSLFRMTPYRAVVPANEEFREQRSGVEGLKSANSLYFSLFAGIPAEKG